MTDAMKHGLTELYNHTRDGHLLDEEFHNVQTSTLRNLARANLARCEAPGLYRITLKGIAIHRGAIQPEIGLHETNQREVYNHLQTHVGLTNKQLAEALNIKVQAVREATADLFKNNKIQRAKNPKSTHIEYQYYPLHVTPPHPIDPIVQPKKRKPHAFPRPNSVAQQILDSLKEQPDQTSVDLRNNINVGQASVYKNIAKLHKRKLIEQTGWIINNFKYATYRIADS